LSTNVNAFLYQWNTAHTRSPDIPLKLDRTDEEEGSMRGEGATDEPDDGTGARRSERSCGIPCNYKEHYH
jgi:hypothetical protein